MPKISLIYTAYNQAPFFEEMILPALRKLTFQDFELVVGDDGSSDDIQTLLKSEKRHLGVHDRGMPIKYVSQPDNGYGYTSIVNKAVAMAEGEYLVFLSGDTFPKPDFLTHLLKTLDEDRIVNGLRENVKLHRSQPYELEGSTPMPHFKPPVGIEVLSQDWRLRYLPYFERQMMVEGHEDFPLQSYPTPWVHFTMNTLACSRKIWDTVGGLTPQYDGGYGKMDWSFVMKAFFSGFGLWWNVKAVAYTEDDGRPGRPDSEENSAFFNYEIIHWENKSKNKV